MRYVIGTRGSKLALAQSEFVMEQLKEAYPDDEFELKVIVTTGDKDLNTPLPALSGKGVFVKEIEKELLSGEIDLAVHSMKDMPPILPKGLILTNAWTREDASDALVSDQYSSIEELPEHAVIGTSSIRRKTQLLQLRPDLCIVDVRGNVETRIRKMREQKMDGILLATAGLKRLGLENRIAKKLDTDVFVPACCQGILAIEMRESDMELRKKLDKLADKDVTFAAECERTFLTEMGGDCKTPVGGNVKKTEDGYQLTGWWCDQEGICTKSTLPGQDPYALARAVSEVLQEKTGRVFLVGAGPFDEELLTLKAAHLIQTADCIIYDRLLNPKILQWAKEDCECIYVGKENHHHTLAQDGINELIAKKAKEHHMVVRLKGGDPYVFGRGGEEGAYLYQQGIPFEVVPGISSCIAGPQAAGIPVTHRGLSMGFQVHTAHSKRDELADLDYKAMAASGDTLIFLMGLGVVEQLTKKLIEAGLSGDTPAAVVSNATMPGQETLVSDVRHLAEETEKNKKITSPAIIVIGQVVTMRNVLATGEEIQKKKLLLPVLQKNENHLVQMLTKKGYEVNSVLVGAIEYLEEKVEPCNYLIVTSKNGVEGFRRAIEASQMDIRSFSRTKFVSLGKKVSDALRKIGITADIEAEKPNSESLVEALLPKLNTHDSVGYLKAEETADTIKDALSGQCDYREFVLYRNKKCEITFTGTVSEYEGILFTSASMVRRMAEYFDSAGRLLEFQLCHAYSIGPVTTNELQQVGVKRITEAHTSSYEGMCSLL